MSAIFKPIPSFPNYSISKCGRVIRNKTTLTTSHGVTRVLSESERKIHVDKRGYPRVSLGGSARLLHRLIAETFISNPHGYPCVDHINGNPSDFSLKNLRWVTQQTNLLNRHRVIAKSGYVGVHKLKGKLRKPWVACGKLNRKAIHLGTFETAEQASVARAAWEKSIGATTFKNTEKHYVS